MLDATVQAFPAEGPAAEACFHCGLPVSPGERSRVHVAGEWRSFCCPACKAVACAIVDHGLDDYYRLRTAAAGRRPEAAEPYAEFDDAGFQQSFVRSAADGTREASLLLEGMRCSACVWLTEQVIERLPGVEAAAVNYATRRALVRWDQRRVALSEILAAVARIGYRASPYQRYRVDAIHEAERRDALWRLFVAGFGMMQVMMYAVPSYLAADGTMSDDIVQLMRWASLVLTVPVVAYSAQPFFLGAWRDLRLGRLGMDVPVALGVAIAFGASVWATLTGRGEVWFDSITMFVFLLLAGRFLESKARANASQALTYLMRLVPASADRLCRYPESLDCERVSATALRAGQLVLVRPGAAVPADGSVVRGRSDVDEALLTGESRPRLKVEGSALVGGSINLAQPLVMRVEQAGQDTVLAAITRLVERALAERQPLAVLADRYAHWFVLAVLVVAAGAGAAWALAEPTRALWVAVSVLIVACPCALSLATPASLTAATGELARGGFVATRGHAIETLARTTDVVLDKTGTLTHGAPRVTAATALGPEPIDACVAITAAIERASEHPLARAFADLAGAGSARRPAVASAANHPGRGVEAVVDGERVRIGGRAFCAEIAGGPRPERERAAAATLVYLARTNAWLARFDVEDALRPGARELVRSLERMGKRVHLVSGDHPAAVERVTAEAGIARACAEADPQAKCAYVQALQRNGALVAVVGDGVNDAPVLAQADVSVAMGQGADLAQASADAVLVTGDLAGLAAALELAARTLRVIRQNLFWATAYNLAAVAAAAAGLVSPWMAALGMSTSSLAVVCNALRLRRRARPGAPRSPRRG